MKASSRKLILLAFLAAFFANHFRHLAMKHLQAEVAFRHHAAAEGDPKK